MSQELSDTINTMVANCNVLNRARAQPPPGVLKPIRPGSGVGVDVSFPPGTLSSQLFPPPGVDSTGLSPSLSSMGLGPPTSSGFAVNIGSNTLGGNTPAPGSPGKLFSSMSLLETGNELHHSKSTHPILITNIYLLVLLFRSQSANGCGDAKQFQLESEPKYFLHFYFINWNWSNAWIIQYKSTGHRDSIFYGEWKRERSIKYGYEQYWIWYGWFSWIDCQWPCSSRNESSPRPRTKNRRCI